MMKVEVEKRNGKHICSIDLPKNATLEDLKVIFDETRHYYPERQRWTQQGGQPLEEGKLEHQGVKNGSILTFKDLGVQISWRLVFVLEYLGPLLIAPVFYFQSPRRSLTQHVAFVLLMAHFIKREFETLFIHRFSHGTMPLIRLPINCFHYWILCGLAICHYLFHPNYVGQFDNAKSPYADFMIYALAGVMLTFESLNLEAHVALRKLRPRGSKTRRIPHGWGFDHVSCANYLWEVCSWLTFSILVGCLTSWVFTAVAAFQMTEWALKKHRNYLKEFKEYPRSRKAIFPMLL